MALYTPTKPVLRRLVDPQIALLGSYPPRACGIATFTADVATALDQESSRPTKIIAIDEPGADRMYRPNVHWRLQQHNPQSYLDTAAAIGKSNVKLVNIQHEYGLFGGDDGEMLLSFINAVPQPVVTTLHTVVPNPSPHFRAVTRALFAASAEMVVLARSATPLLRDAYGIDPERVTFIPHGIPSVPRRPGMRRAMKLRLGLSGRTVLSTFGLLNPDKGIEYVLEALPALVERYPDLLFLIIGETHPGIRQHSGESYRNSLQALVDEGGLHEHVRFVNQYLTLEDLLDYLVATDVYLMAYLNPDQIVSGTLAYALGSGKAVVATPFRYAQEMLADERGVIVPFRSSEQIMAALDDLLKHPSKRAVMEEKAYIFSRNMEWHAVAAAYQAVFQRHIKASGAAVYGPQMPNAKAAHV